MRHVPTLDNLTPDELARYLAHLAGLDGPAARHFAERATQALNIWRPRVDSLGRLVQLGAAIWSVLPADIMNKRQSSSGALARAAVYAVAKETLPHSYPEIGRYFGRCHSVVQQGEKRARLLERMDEDFASRIARLREAVRHGRDTDPV